ncbi:Ig-like domain-containing protein [Flavobacterium undicola]|uniref:Ig-like domain-containing protein n=1 Tax=Flavobacterium undicola TaxID=1932779 RepID=UPI00293BB13E|nr:Ig-like domain-containing protein [Flavobacterium undicola]
MASCAKRGSITGGLKDTIAPSLKMSFPENFSSNFNEKQIKLEFDEIVILKTLSKQLVISPPMKNEPLIIPTTASKYITIKIKDTLKPNTTYSFNFGQSITDNNEGNPLNQFKYVFSTGSYIDSLALGGKVKYAYEKEAESFISVMLYEVNDTFNDSIIYKESPRYITNTLDSLKTFRLENLKAGKYFLVALKDLNKNNKFDPKTEKIGFIKDFISIPNDTIYEIELFKETSAFKAFKPTQESANKLFMGYEGDLTETNSRPKITLKNNNEILSSIVTKLPKKDSLQIWYKPLKTDSLKIAITHDKFEKVFTLKTKNQKKDSLTISSINPANFKDRFVLEASRPLIKFDETKIKLIDGDSTAIKFTKTYDEFNQKLYLDFKKEPAKKYSFTILPGALTDFYESTNDTLNYQISTKELTEYGNLKVKLENVKSFPVIVELLKSTGEIVASEYLEKDTAIDFNLLDPALFTLRAIYDNNKNNRFDSGNYLEKKYAEEVIYLSGEIDVRTNWDVEQTFDLSIPYTPPVKKDNKDKKKKKQL